VPAELTTTAAFPGIPNARFWVDTDLESLLREAEAALKRERAFLAKSPTAGNLPPLSILAISGGGDNGAFGAGLLNGWTAAGNRPKFKVVTGVSTGALIAPFAFLGPEYDESLKTVYTGVTQKNIFLPRSIWATMTKDAMSDTKPLWGLLSQMITDDLLARVAQEYRNGRLLLVGTTDLDALRPVMWNMGAIAASGAPNARDLFCQVLMASASIPGAFPPVMIDVEVDGKRYQEMHVDGGAMAQVFLYPPGLMELVRANKGVLAVDRERKAYIIRNARFVPEWASVKRWTPQIAMRSIDSLLTTQGLGDLYRIYFTCRKDGMDYNLAHIGADFTVPHTAQFEPTYMKALFDYGYELGSRGYPWKKTPPGMEEPK
jgi:predicted acylesterase/phospholipase RssA